MRQPTYRRDWSVVHHQLNHSALQILALADADVDVLVLGQTGTGKEVVARGLHDFSSRKTHLFTVCPQTAQRCRKTSLNLNYSVMRQVLLPVRIRLGLANSNMPTVVRYFSMKLNPCHWMFKRSYCGHSKIERLSVWEPINPIQLDVRFIAATKVDLGESSGSGGFRSDLYYRLNVAALQIPPLRDRKEDIPLLTNILREKRNFVVKYRPSRQHWRPLWSAMIGTWQCSRASKYCRSFLCLVFGMVLKVKTQFKTIRLVI